MKRQSINLNLYHLIVGWVILTVGLGLYFLFGATAPTSDVVAKVENRLRRLSLKEFEPGEPISVHLDGKPLVVWRRSQAEMLEVAQLLDPTVDITAVARALEEGTLAQEIGPITYNVLEWIIVSPRDTGGIGCIALPQAGDFGGFFDPCRGSHFDMLGRIVKGPSTRDLLRVPARFDEDGLSVVIDLSVIERR